MCRNFRKSLKPKTQQKSDGAAKPYLQRKTPMTVAEMKEAASSQAVREYFQSVE